MILDSIVVEKVQNRQQLTVRHGAATAWKYQEPPRQVVVGLIMIAGSLGLLLWAVVIAVQVPNGT